MLENVLLVYSGTAGILIYYHFLRHFSDFRITVKSKRYMISLITIAIIVAISFLKIFLLNTFIYFVALVLFSKIIFACRTSYALFISIFFVMLGMGSEIATSFGITFLFNVGIKQALTMSECKFIIYILSKILLFLIIHMIIVLFPNRKKDKHRSSSILFFLFPFFAILNQLVLIYFTKQLHLNRFLLLFCMVIGLGLMYGGLLLIYLYDYGIQKRTLQNELCLEKQKFDDNERFYHLQEQLFEETRIRIHDMKNHMIHLHEHYEDITLDGRSYYASLMASLDKQMAHQLLAVNNKVLSNIIYRATLRCEQANITFAIKSNVFDLGFIDPLDTSSIFDNAIDNAIHACSNRESDQAPWIEIDLLQSPHFLLFHFKNTYFHEIIEKNGVLISTQTIDQEHHGIGIGSIFRTAEKYGGDGVFEYSHDVFQLSVRVQSEK